LTGAQQQRPRDKRALDALDFAMGDAVGKLYVEKFLPASAKTEVEGMVEGIKDAFARRVEDISWMAPQTREEALKKVKSIEVGVAYPDTWKTYADLKVDPANA